MDPMDLQPIDERLDQIISLLEKILERLPPAAMVKDFVRRREEELKQLDSRGAHAYWPGKKKDNVSSS